MNIIKHFLNLLISLLFCILFLGITNHKKIEIIYVTKKPLKEVVIISYKTNYPEIIRHATTYMPYEKLHTSKDGSHLTMAGGKRINPSDCFKKYIAVSRDLKWLYPFGTIVEITNAGDLSGIYEVQDLKGSGYKHQIDILVPSKMYRNSSYKVKIKILKKGNGKYFKKTIV